MSATVSINSTPATVTDLSIVAVSATRAEVAAGQLLDFSRSFPDEGVRQMLLDVCIERLTTCQRDYRRLWMQTIQTLVDERPLEIQQRLDAERLARASR